MKTKSAEWMSSMETPSNANLNWIRCHSRFSFTSLPFTFSKLQLGEGSLDCMLLLLSYFETAHFCLTAPMNGTSGTISHSFICSCLRSFWQEPDLQEVHIPRWFIQNGEASPTVVWKHNGIAQRKVKHIGMIMKVFWLNNREHYVHLTICGPNPKHSTPVPSR